MAMLTGMSEMGNVTDCCGFVDFAIEGGIEIGQNRRKKGILKKNV